MFIFTTLVTYQRKFLVIIRWHMFSMMLWHVIQPQNLSLLFKNNNLHWENLLVLIFRAHSNVDSLHISGHLSKIYFSIKHIWALFFKILSECIMLSSLEFSDETSFSTPVMVDSSSSISFWSTPMFFFLVYYC